MYAIELAQQAIVLSLIWYAIAKYFYLHHARMLAYELLDDPQYREKADRALMQHVKSQVSGVLDAVESIVSAEFKQINIPEFDWNDTIEQHFVSMLNGWYGNLHKAQGKQQAAEDANIRDAVQYANMNKDNPAALDMIQQALAAKSPILAAGMAMLQNQNSRLPPQQGRGGY